MYFSRKDDFENGFHYMPQRRQVKGNIGVQVLGAVKKTPDIRSGFPVCPALVSTLAVMLPWR